MYKKQLFQGLGLVCGLLLCVSCSSEKKQDQAVPPFTATHGVGAVRSLEPKEFQAALQETPDAVILDVRTPEEIAQGQIAGAKPMNFKDEDFEARLSDLDKSKTYFVYCAVGGRSGKTVNLMHEKGFQKIINLDGGFEAWKEQGLQQSKP